MKDGALTEFVESVQPPLAREDKWVLLVSTMYGCPIKCAMCDAGGHYHGKPDKEEIFEQIDYIVRKRYPDLKIPCRQFKIQFARMGEPSLNDAVLDVLRELPSRYDAPGLIPSLSTIAPHSADNFFEKLLDIKQAKYAGGNFQMQFSIHTTDTALRDKLMPVKKWGFDKIAEYGKRFYKAGDRKITLNFALAKDTPFDAAVLLKYFTPDIFLIKITPLNPTYSAVENRLTSYIDGCNVDKPYPAVEQSKKAGYEVILSIGHNEENLIGSNCGQYVQKHLKSAKKIQNGYAFVIKN